MTSLKPLTSLPLVWILVPSVQSEIFHKWKSEVVTKEEAEEGAEAEEEEEVDSKEEVELEGQSQTTTILLMSGRNCLVLKRLRSFRKEEPSVKEKYLQLQQCKIRQQQFLPLHPKQVHYQLRELKVWVIRCLGGTQEEFLLSSLPTDVLMVTKELLPHAVQ
jgi:hypothetical protein